jgi:hypothetical protein
MFRRIAGTSLATLIVGATALAAASFATTGSAEAFGGRYERGYETPAYGWRPPPTVHGYWGQRRWQHYNDHGYRAPPPPPARYGYGYGWR